MTANALGADASQKEPEEETSKEFASDTSSNLQTGIIQRRYCTEVGPFDLLFDSDEIAGAYAILPKNILGASWARLNGFKAIGRWHDPDGKGDIHFEFSPDWTFFTTDYRADDEPEVWYRDQWHGALMPSGNPESFTKDGGTYRCR